MPASLVQEAHANGTTGGTASVTLTAAPTPGWLLVAVVSVNGIGTTNSTPFNAVADVTVADATAGARCYSTVAASGESATVAMTYGTTSGTVDLHVYEFAPTPGRTWGAATRLDKVTSAAAGASVSTQSTGTTAALTDPDSLAVAASAANGSAAGAVTATNGYDTNAQAGTRGRVTWRAVSTTDPQETTLGTFTTARRTAAALAVYRQQGAASAGFTNPGAFLSFM